MKIIVGLGGAPKNPSHSDVVAIARRIRSGLHLDETVQCIYCTSQDLAIPPQNSAYPYSTITILCDTLTRPRGTVRYFTLTLRYQSTPQRNFTVLYHTVTSRHDTTPQPDQTELCRNRSLLYHNSTELHNSAPYHYKTEWYNTLP